MNPNHRFETVTPYRPAIIGRVVGVTLEKVSFSLAILAPFGDKVIGHASDGVEARGPVTE